MEYWILWDAAQLESQLWRIASSLGVQWPQNKLLKVQIVQKLAAFRSACAAAVFFIKWDLVVWPELPWEFFQESG